MNVGPFQILIWPRWTLCYIRPTPRTRGLALYRHIYRFVVYLWPVEVRMFR